MLPNLKTAAISAVAALALALTSASPAAAWGQRERDVLKGAVGALILKAIIDDANRDTRRQPVYREVPQPRYYDDKRYREDEGYHHEKRRGHSTSIYRTTLASAFNSYAAPERRQIQKRLAHWGYYRGRIDGSFGPGTYSAITAYAQDQGRGRDLASAAGSYGVLDGLIY